MSGVNWWVRRATAEDNDDVISILQDSEYDGDYLSDYFHILIKNQLCYPYVCLVDDKIKCTFYAGSKTSVQKSIQKSQNDCSSTTLLDEVNFRKIIASKEKYPNVFKDGRLAVDSVLYQIYKENVPLILMERTSAVISYPEIFDKTLLTFCSYFRLLNGETFCKLDIYGKIGSTLLEHIKLHLRIVMEHVSDVFTIDVRCNEDIDLIDHAMIDIGMKKVPAATYSYKGRAFYERPVVTQSRL